MCPEYNVELEASVLQEFSYIFRNIKKTRILIQDIAIAIIE